MVVTLRGEHSDACQSHIFFVCRQRKAQRIDAAYIPYRAPLGVYGSCLALVFLIVLILTKGAEAFIGRFDVRTFVVQYVGIPVYLLCILGYKSIRRSRRVRSGEADLITDVPQETVAEERARFEQAQRQKEDATTGATLDQGISHISGMAILSGSIC